ncbi:hypothetical protein EVAR_32715_1 [Eumeta japonica]|uniref:Uncharacterized protein n=1 Tax=Eumeta variegata TaxID=151549 RepID=A0A4C1Z8A7_EUMVA|nr:hypothetical protein EVAR_32715_1 [Eumeta japonica]
MLYVFNDGVTVNSDPAWNERVRRRRTFADAELDRGTPGTLPAPPPHLPAPVLCRQLLTSLLRSVLPPPPSTPKISFSIESIIGVI